MQRIKLLVFAVPALLIACGGSSTVDDFRNGLPRGDTVQMNVPKSSGQALETGQVQQAALGAISLFYLATRTVTDVVNGGTGLVLAVLGAITHNPPTSFNGHVAVWGPYTEPLHANTYRLTATDLGNHQYAYVLDAKAKWDPDTAYVSVLTGTHSAATDSQGHPLRAFGNGSFTIDWDKARSLPEHNPDEMGKGDFTYSRTSPTSQVEISVNLTQVLDASTGQRVDVKYHYVSAPGGDGMFQFSTYSNPGAALVRASIESRWKSTGAGRSDVMYVDPAHSPNVPTANECWDERFASVYFHSSTGSPPDYGNAAACVFSQAEYSSL